MAVLFAPQYQDPNAELKQYMLQMALMLRGKKQEKKLAGQREADISSLGQYGQYQQQVGQAESLQQSLMGLPLEQRQEYKGPAPQWPPSQPFPQIQSPELQQLAGRAQLQRALGQQSGGIERGTLPWYQWPEYKDSPAAKRARGELPRVTKPFSPLSRRYTAEDIETRIEVIKSGPQKGPGAGKIRGPDYAQSDIIHNYIQEAETIGYRSLSAAQQRQFDALWDTKMRGQKDFVWNPKSKEVKAARSALRTGNLPTGVSNEVETEPKTVEEFERRVDELKTSGDMETAKTYYDKWANKWQ